MQNVAWVTSVALMAGVAGVFVMVAISARSTADYKIVVEKGYRLRKIVFGVLVTTGVVACAGTLGRLPYAQAAQEDTHQIVNALGYQWYWELSQETVKRGQPVEFRVTATDVTHGFAIYDADLNLVTQTQAMPGYINTLHHTFDRPGTYKVLCLEYCGLSHHGMIAELTVSD